MSAASGFEVPSTSVTPRPLDGAHYRRLRDTRPGPPVERRALDDDRGAAVVVGRGDLLRVRLPAGPQVVGMFPLNQHDPDERLWHQTMVSEGLFVTRYSRLWSTMARCRPLLTVLDDTVATRPIAAGQAFHHPLLGTDPNLIGWRRSGGDAAIRSNWEQMADAAAGLGIPTHVIDDPVHLFRKQSIVPGTERFRTHPSDAVAGDEVRFFAEIDLVVLFSLDPHVDDRDPRTPTGDVRPVEIVRHAGHGEPLEWPYPGQPRADVSAYVDAGGLRRRTSVGARS